MITIFSRISDVFLMGVDSEMEVEKAISIKYGNQIALINTVLTFQGGVYVYYLLGKSWILGIITLIALMNLVTFPLNYLKYHVVARVMPWLVCSIGVFLTSALFGKESNIHTLNTIIIIGAIMAHSDANIKTYVLLVIFPLLLTLYLFLTDFTLFDSYFVLPNAQQLQISDNVFFISMVSALVATLFYIYRTRRASERLSLSQDALSRRYNELEKINQEMDRFVYSVSHDLRAPVVSALGLVELSLKEDNLENIKHYLKLQDKSLWKLEKFIAEILTYSRNARLEINKDKIDFQAIINESIQLQNLHLPSSPLSISTQLEIDVPFFSDHQRLQAVFNNLISNAARYRDTAKTQSLLAIKIKTCSEYCTIVLTDNGQGIEEKYLPRIFEMFYRAHNRSEGSGLGLFIVKEILDKLNGTISVHSVFKEGTTFTITIPNNVN